MSMPAPGTWYQVRHGDGGLLTLTGRAYGLRAGASRMRLAQRVNAHPLNRRFWRTPRNAFEREYFPGGLVSLTPAFACEEPRSASGRCLPRLFIPPLETRTHPQLGPLVPLPTPPGAQPADADVLALIDPRLFDLGCRAAPGPGADATHVGSVDERQPADAFDIIGRLVCSLTIVFRSPMQRSGLVAGRATGLRIGPNHVLTAAHALFSNTRIEDRFHGVWTNDRAVLIAIAFGRDGPIVGATNPRSHGAYYTAGASNFWMPPEWIERTVAGEEPSRFPQSKAFDYALIRFSPQDRETAVRPRSIDLEAWSDKPRNAISDSRRFWSQLRMGQRLQAHSYPGDKPCEAWATSGPLAALRSVGRARFAGVPKHAWLEIDADSIGGMSGSPIWRERTLAPDHPILEPTRQRVLCSVLSAGGLDAAGIDGMTYGPALTPFVWQRLRAQGVPV